MRGCCCCDCYCYSLHCLQAEGLLAAQQLLHIQAFPLPRPAAVELHGGLPQQVTAAGLSSQLAGAAPAATTGHMQVSLPSSLCMRTGQSGNETGSIELQGAWPAGHMMVVLTLHVAEAPPRSCCGSLRHMEAAMQRQSCSSEVAIPAAPAGMQQAWWQQLHSPCGSAGASS